MVNDGDEVKMMEEAEGEEMYSSCMHLYGEEKKETKFPYLLCSLMQCLNSHTVRRPIAC